jgi:hypothetical protein
MRIRKSMRGITGLLTVAGGALLIVAAPLHWITVQAGRHSKGGALGGLSLVAGRVALGAGVLLLAAGLVMWLVHAERLRRWVAVAALVAAAAAVTFVVSRIAVSGSELKPGTHHAAPAAQIGAILALVGGGAALLGSAAGLGTSIPGASNQAGPAIQREHPSPPPPPIPVAPSGETTATLTTR